MPRRSLSGRARLIPETAAAIVTREPIERQPLDGSLRGSQRGFAGAGEGPGPP